MEKLNTIEIKILKTITPSKDERKKMDLLTKELIKTVDKLIKKEAGERVELAIDQVLKKDPLVNINASFVNKKVSSIIKKDAPFVKVKKGYATRTAAGNQQEVKVFNNIMNLLLNHFIIIRTLHLHIH